MFKKILVPLDGSDLAATILPQVEDLAKAMQAQVTLMTVESLFSVFEDGFVPDGYGDYFDQMRVQAEKYLTEIGGRLKAKGVATDWTYKEGQAPAREIIGEVAWVIGSIAEKVVTHATIPVLLLRVLKAKKLVGKAEYIGPD